MRTALAAIVILLAALARASDVPLATNFSAENAESKPLTVSVLSLASLNITSPQYAITGMVRYENVEGHACLEMWSHFPNGNAFFSRTLAESGPMQFITGSSDWRPFTVPFFNEPNALPPGKLEFNVVFPGKGKVFLKDINLTQQAGSSPLGTPAGAWWSDRTAGIVGGSLGGLFGCLGALIGILAGLGRGRRFVLALLKLMVALGIVSLLAGLAALAAGQPYAVYYPLLLIGVILAAVCGFNLPQVRRRYDDLELRKMRAMDA